MTPQGGPTTTQEGLGYPRGFKVEVSSDGTTWQTVAETAATGASTIVTFAPVQASRLRLSLTTTVENSPAWSLQDLRVLALQMPR